MREPQARRDQREIVVPAPTRPREPRPGARRRPIGGPAAPVGWFATLCAILRGTGRLALRQPGTVFGSLLAVGAVTVVSMNALGYQMGRHPAPIFPKVAARPAVPAKTDSAKTDSTKTDSTRTAPAKAADTASRPDAARTETAKPEPVKAEASRPPRSEEAKAEPAPRAPARDTIGEIIKAGETTASVTPKTDRTIALAQRALVKLGYGPLKADGVLGAGTRTAIEKFERDRKLPVKGEPAGRTMRELVARAAIPQG